MKRPLVAFSFACIAGVICADAWSGLSPRAAISLAALLFAAGLCLGLFLLRRWRQGLYFFSALLLFYLLAFSLRLAQKSLPSDHLYSLRRQGRTDVEGRVVSMPRRGFRGASYELKVHRCRLGRSWRECRGRVRLYLYDGDELLAPGEMVRVSGKLGLPARALNPGQFDYRRYLANGGIHQELRAAALSCRRLQGDWLTSLGRRLLRLRLAAEQALDDSLGRETARPMKAFLFGEKSELEPSERDDFNRTGIAHVLAVSGLHVGLVLGFFYFALRLLRCPLRWAMLGALFCAVLYTLSTGAGLPAIRATLMAAVAVLSFLFGRESDLFSAVLLVGLFFLLLNPGSLYLAGFQLSFLATLGIIALAPRLEKRLDFIPGRYLRSLAAVAVSAQLSVLPLTAYHFHLVAPVGFLFNLLVVPLLSVALALGFVTMLLCVAAPFLAQVFGASGGLAASLLLRSSKLCAALPGGYFHLPSPMPITVAAYYLLLFSLAGYLFSSRRGRVLLLALLLLCLNGELVRSWQRAPRGELEVSFIAVGQGDAALLRRRGGGAMLIDCGRGPPADAGSRVIAPFLWEMGVRRLDAVVLSHADYDHVGGLRYLLRNFKVASVVEAVGARGESKAYRELEGAVEEAGVKRYFAALGQEIGGLGEVKIKVLHPPLGGYPGDANDNSLVFLVESGGFRAFFGGDAGRKVEESLLAALASRRLDVLKVGHHGSSTSTSARFLSAARPRLAVVSCAEREEHKLPNTEVLKSLLFSGARVLRTDKCGMVTVVVGEDGRVEVDVFVGD